MRCYNRGVLSLLNVHPGAVVSESRVRQPSLVNFAGLQPIQWLVVCLGTVDSISCSEYRLKGEQDVKPGLSDTSVYWPPVEVEHDLRRCDQAVELTDEVSHTDDCRFDTETGSISATVEWSMTTFNNYGEYDQILMAPVVGHLTDDNGDGVRDHRDIPDIVVITDDDGIYSHQKGILRVIPGDGSGGATSFQRADTDEWQVYPYRYGNLALGDVDRDSIPEIVAIVQVVSNDTPDGGGGDSGGESGGDDGAAEGGEGGGGGKGEDTEIIETGLEAGGGGSGGGEGGGSGDPPDETGSPSDGEEEGSDDPLDHPVWPSGGSGTPSYTAGDVNKACTVAAFTAEGEVLWVSTALSVDCWGHAPALADLEGDGTVEVLIGPSILEGEDGTLRATGEGGEGRYFAYYQIGMHSIASDLNLDGTQEVIAGQTIYDPQGQIVCQAASLSDGFPAAADLDMDGLGEVAIVGNGTLSVMEDDCTVTMTTSLAGMGNGGPPTIADFDSDGVPEIGVADADTYSVYETDGSVLWSMAVEDDSSHATGSLVYDFEGDGRPEVVYADETRLWVFAGADGAIRLTRIDHASRTLHDYPTVADVDGDGSSEIIVVNGGGHQGENLGGLYVLGPASGSWLASRQVWNQHAYSITNINDDLSIPSPPLPNWPYHNNFRSGDPQPVSAGAAPDVVPIAEVCYEECAAGRVRVTVAVGNAGAAPLRDGVPVSVYSQDGALMTHLGTGWTSSVLGIGEVSEPIEIVVDSGDLVDPYLVIKADDNEGAEAVPRECSEDNNVVILDAQECLDGMQN